MSNVYRVLINDCHTLNLVPTMAPYTSHRRTFNAWRENCKQDLSCIPSAHHNKLTVPRTLHPCVIVIVIKYRLKDITPMLFKLAVAILASSTKLPAVHGTGFVRRATTDDSNSKSKADKDSFIDKDEEEPLTLVDMQDIPSEINQANSFAELTPEPRSFSVGNSSLTEQWNHGTTAVTSANDGTIKFYAPTDTQVGDTLFLFLSRTDGLLPLRIDDWNRGSACFKSFNNQESCMRASHCVNRDGPYCLEFDAEAGGGDGRDLGTVVFYHHVTVDDPGCWTVQLPGKSTVWAIVTAIPKVDRDRPIFRTHGTSCDAEWESEFPSVYG